MSTDAAPGRLERVREFVNTRDIDEGTDGLTSPGELASWLERRDLLIAGARVGPRELKRAIELREAFRGLLLANNGGAPDSRSIQSLDRAAADAALSVRFDADGSPALAVAGSGAGSVVGPLVAIAYEAMVAGTWSRLKACAADDCHWAFYDRSKNRSGTWCSMRVCGNRAKVRAYRERRDAQEPGSQAGSGARA
jgi:predicted RNA-binding Zn ribbon-like protein